MWSSASQPSHLITCFAHSNSPTLQFVVGEIEKLLANNSTQQENIAELEKACNILPKSIAGECDTIVSTYGPELIQDLVKYGAIFMRLLRSYIIYPLAPLAPLPSLPFQRREPGHPLHPDRSLLVRQEEPGQDCRLWL